VTHPPCGVCRQMLNELHRAEALQIFLPGPTPRSVLVRELLPSGFGPMDLGHSSALGCEVSNGLQLLAAPAGDEDLVRMALESANRSYAPYSACPSGVALQLSSGEIVQGSYWESCAFNPSISPVQAGIVSVISAGASPADIVVCVLVQLLDARVSQARGPAPVSQPWQPSILA